MEKIYKAVYILMIFLGIGIQAACSEGVISILNLEEGDTVSGLYTIQGILSSTEGISSVCIKVNNGPWETAGNTADWNYQLDYRNIVTGYSYRFDPVMNRVELIYKRGVVYGDLPISIAAFDERGTIVEEKNMIIRIIPEKPVADKAPGIYNENTTVALQAKPETSIYYTLNGDDPDINSFPYSNPLTLTEDTVIKVIAVCNDLTSEIFILNIDIDISGKPSFRIQYFADSGLTAAYEDNPYLKEGTYYLRIESSKQLRSNPTISIDAEGVNNDVSGREAIWISGYTYRYERFITGDLSAAGKIRENISITGIDLAGNASCDAHPVNEDSKSAFTDTIPPSTGSISITDSGGYTNDNTPPLTLSSDGASFMRFAVTEEGLAGAQWIPYAEFYDGFDISTGGDGVKNVWVGYKDSAGNIQSIHTSDSVYYDSSVPSFDIEYYSNPALTVSLGNNPYLKAGTYYLKITSNRDLPENPVIRINAEGTDNDVADAATVRVSGRVYRFTRIIAFDPLAAGIEKENILITGIDPSNANLKSAFTDTVAPVVNAGNDIALTNTAANLDATVTDGCPFLSFRWGKISGAGTVIFENNTACTTTIAGEEGIESLFLIRLTATDKAGNSSSDTLIFNWDKKAPVVDAGADIPWTNARAELHATAADANGIESLLWEKTAGTGTVIFDGNTIAGVDGEEAAYMIQLTATDKAGNSASDTLLFNWDKKAPVVEAGDDIPWTNIRANLDAMVADAGPVTLLWEKTGGFGSVVFGNNTMEDTTITGTDGEAGSFTIQLTATDAAGNSAGDTLIFNWDKKKPVVDAGDDIPWTNIPALLNAAVTDEGPFTCLWEAAPDTPVTYTEDFENGALGDGWTVGDASLYGNWYVSGFASYSGDYSLMTPQWVDMDEHPYVEFSYNTPVPGNIGFYLKMNNGYAGETATGYLNFYIDGIHQGCWGSMYDIDWQYASFVVAEGEHVFRWVYTGCHSTDQAFIDFIRLPGTPAGSIIGNKTDPHTFIAGQNEEMDSFTVTLTATDEAGNTGSDSLKFYWDKKGPAVDAGSDIGIINTQAHLHGTASDINGISGYLWEKAAGAGTVLFGDNMEKDTTIEGINGEARAFTIRLTAADSLGNTGSDSLIFNWDKIAPGTPEIINWIFPNSQSAAALNSIFFVDADTGWAAGNNGVILHTENCGKTWEMQSSGTANHLQSVFFINRNTGWVVGANGTILYTEDAGENWISKKAGTTRWLNTVFFIDASNGWISGAGIGSGPRLLHTTDGGNTWKDGGAGIELSAVYFTDINHGWGVKSTSYGILHTSDGGVNWSEQDIPVENLLYAIHFTDPDQGWAVGFAGTILHTGDGGAHWILQNSGTSTRLNTVFFADDNNGWAAGCGSTILHTTDGGNHWEVDNAVTGEDILSANAPAANNGWLCGTNGVIINRTKLDNGSIRNCAVKVVFKGESGATFQYSFTRDEAVYPWPPDNTFTEEGLYTITAAQTDAAGNTGENTVLLFEIDTTPPAVYAGADIPWTNTPANLSGTAWDASGISSCRWKKTEGSGTVIFADSRHKDTTISGIDEEETFTIEFTAVDGGGNTASDTLLFNWDKKVQWVEAGGDIPWTNTPVALHAAASDTNGIAGWLWEKTGGSGSVVFADKTDADTTIGGMDGEEEPFTIRLTVADTLGNTADDSLIFHWDKRGPTVEAGSDITWTNTEAFLNGTATDTNGVGSYLWENISASIGMRKEGFEEGKFGAAFSSGGQANWTIDSSNTFSGNYSAKSGVLNPNWGTELIMTADIPQDGTIQFSFKISGGYGTLYFHIDGGINKGAWNSNADWTTVSFPVAAGTHSFLWSYQNFGETPAGTAWLDDIFFTSFETAAFGDNSAPHTTIAGRDNEEESFVIRLTATDGLGNSGSDTLLFNWDKKPPSVEAGNDIPLTGFQADLDATVTDINPIAGCLWEKAAGAGSVGFGDNTREDTTITGPPGEEGSFTIRLTATDSMGNSASDTLIFDWDNIAPDAPSVQGWEDWHCEGGMPMKESLKAICFINTHKGWAVGAAGTIVHTKDGGNAWFKQDSGITGYLYAVRFVDDNNGWAAGANGTILHTADGGSSWFLQNSGSTKSLQSLCFINAATGWVVGESGIILHTIDGGINWSVQNSGTSAQLRSVYFADENHGWIAGNSVILKTTDGGASWTGKASSTLYSICFTDIYTGWAVGAVGNAVYTTDGGENWITMSLGTYSSIYSIYFADSKTGWAVGSSGTILHTTDGGSHWSVQSSNSSQTLESVYFADKNTGWIVGANSEVLYTLDGGAGWHLRNSGTVNDLESVYFTDSDNGWAAGRSGTIIHTGNGGLNWISQASGTTAWLYAVYFTDNNTGWAVGETGTILHTVDGGATWVSQAAGTTAQLTAVYFTDSNTGWITVGYKSGTETASVLHTTNGGNTWIPQTTNTSQGVAFHAVYFINATTGWIAGGDSFNGGKILHTTDGGSSWDGWWFTAAPAKLYSFYFINNNIAWAVGESGTIVKTADGWNFPENITVQTSGTGENLKSVCFTDACTGWAVGESGTILYTTNGGTSWTVQNTGTLYDLSGVFFTDSHTGYAVSQFGKIINARYIDNNGTVATKVRLVVSCEVGTTLVKTATKNGGVFAWPADNVFREEGVYIISVSQIDSAGNVSDSAVYNFTISVPF